VLSDGGGNVYVMSANSQLHMALLSRRLQL